MSGRSERSLSAWLPFASWLELQGDRSRSAHVEGDLEAPRGGDQAPQTSGGPPAGSDALLRGASEVPRAQPRGLQPVGASDCRTELRMLEGYLQARQEMSVSLSAPGLPAHRAPVVTAKQATALLRAISEPLVSLEVGRLTRRLSSPTKLQPTEERGTLSLWLLPNDDLVLTWQTALAMLQPSEGAGGQQAPCRMAVWEALAHFPEHSFYESEEPVAVIHTLRNDASQRSFYIKPRADLAEQAGAAEQGDGAPASGEGPGLPRMYFWLRGRDLAQAVQGLGRLKSYLRRPPTLAKRAGVPQKKLAEIGGWLVMMEGVLLQQQAQAAQQASAAATPALEGGGQGMFASSSGAWSSGGAGSSESLQHQQQHPTGSSGGAVPKSPASLLPGVLLGKGGGSSPDGEAVPVLSSSRMAAALTSVVSSCHAVPLMGFPGGQGRVAASAAGMASPSTAPASSSLQTGSERSAQGASDGAQGAAPTPATASSTVSASASALYMDRRFNLVAPVAVAVVATSLLQSGGATTPGDQQGLAGLQQEAVDVASVAAQRMAQTALEKSGRRMMEEQLAEAVLSTIRASRSGSGRAHRAQLAQQREREQQGHRRWLTARAMPRIRAAAAAATGAGTAAGPGPASPTAATALVVDDAQAGGPSTPPASRVCEAPAKPAPVALASCGFQLAAFPQPGPLVAAAGAAASSSESTAAQLPVPGSTAGEVAAAAPPPSRLRQQQRPTAAKLADSGGGKVTLGNLQGLLASAAPASSCSDCSTCASKGEASESQGARQEAGSDAGSEVDGPIKAASGKSPKEGHAGSPRHVSLSSLVKLMNGCLDV